MRRLFVSLLVIATVIASPSAAHSECGGANLLDQMPAPQRDAIFERANAKPFATGNFWMAEKGGMRVNLVGTYHAFDFRHDATMTGLATLIQTATQVLVEAGPEEEQALLADLARNPSLMVMTNTTLPQLMSKAEWDDLSSALELRGIPGFFAAKFQPWYVSLLLSTSPCLMSDDGAEKGLDYLIMEEAKAHGVAISALEPHDTVFQIFDQIPLGDQIDMLRYSLIMEDRIDDFTKTMADAYFSGDSRVIWEFMRHESLGLPGVTEAEVDADLDGMEMAMMVNRNRAWVPVIENAATKGPVLAAFGALHLSGEDGVLNLLAQRGWALSPLPIPAQ